MENKQFIGKKILALLGTPRERVDPFRFYANDSINQTHCIEALEQLKIDGADITFIAADDESAKSLLKRAAGLPGTFDVVLQLASISSIAPAKESSSKIQKTGEQSGQLFDVVGNIDVWQTLKETFPKASIAGFDQYQVWYACGDKKTLAEIKQYIDTAAAAPEVETYVTTAPIQPNDNKLTDKHIVITAGKTEERLTTNGDIITNGFSGRQAAAIARSCAKGGAKITLILAKIECEAPIHRNIKTILAPTASEMFGAAKDVLAAQQVDAFIGVAAVADFSLDAPASLMLKEGEAHRFDMQETKSIIGYAASCDPRPKVVVSFAAQSPETIEVYAAKKFKKLGVDITVANPIGPSTAMAKDVARNQVMFITAAGVRQLPEMSKKEVADALLAEVESLLLS